VRKKNNAVIDDYLESTFGQYKTFIKQWLAAYCYTNHQKLPTLILTGPRGSGKNTFAELVAIIFDQLSATVQDISGAFNVPSWEGQIPHL
jgi:replication-associated recombination protein RarA